MDKQQYKRVMEQIQMSDACERKILDAIQQGECTPPAKARVTWKKRSMIALAAAACVGVASIVSVTAAQRTDLLHLLFPDKAELNESAVATDTGIENFTYTGFDGVKLTPVGVVADAKRLHVFIQLSSDSVQVDDAYIQSLNPHVTSGLDSIQINGESGWSETRTDGIPQLVEFGYHTYETETADGCTIDFSYVFEESLPETALHIEMVLENREELPFMEDTLTSVTSIGTLSYDIGVSQVPNRTVDLKKVPLRSKHFTATLIQADIHGFGMDLTYVGSLEGWMSETLAEAGQSMVDCKLEMQDGSTVSMCCSGGSWSADETYHSFNFLFDELIDPSQAAYFVIGNTKISLE